MQKQSRGAGVIPWANGTGANVSSGDVVDLDHRAGIALVDINNGATGSVAVAGCYTVAKDTSDISQGDEVFWDVSGSQATTTQDAGDPRLGIAVVAAGTSASYVDVELNAPRTVGDQTIDSGAGDAAGNSAAIQAIIVELREAGIIARA